MTFTEAELSAIESTVGTLCARRTSPKFKSQLSIEYRIKGHDVTIVEKRPKWDGSPGFTENGVARIKFNRVRKRWRLLWQRADLKWYAYQPVTKGTRLADLVAEVDSDPWGCFFG